MLIEPFGSDSWTLWRSRWRSRPTYATPGFYGWLEMWIGIGTWLTERCTASWLSSPGYHEDPGAKNAAQAGHIHRHPGLFAIVCCWPVDSLRSADTELWHTAEIGYKRTAYWYSDSEAALSHIKLRAIIFISMSLYWTTDESVTEYHTIISLISGLTIGPPKGAASLGPWPHF